VQTVWRRIVDSEIGELGDRAMGISYELATWVKRRHIDRIRTIPNITSVIVHHKRTGGRDTGVLSLRISVLRKKPRSALATDEVIPSEIDGVPTDVYEAPYGAYTADPVRKRPILGGIQVLSLRPNTALQVEDGAGTLGGFVRERASPNRVCALTNYHVVCPEILTEDTGYEVFQPVLGDTTCGLCRDDPIGRVHKTAIGLPLDAAIIALDPKAEKDTLKYNPGDLVFGALGAVRHLLPDEVKPATRFLVKKNGITTGPTHGRIFSGDADIDFVDNGRIRRHDGVIQIKSTEASKIFDQPGDSGALVLTESGNEPVALLFGNRKVTDPTEDNFGGLDGFACFLDDPPGRAFQGVLNALDVDMITGGGPQAAPIPVPAGNMTGVDHRDSNGNVVVSPASRGVVDWADAQMRRSPAGESLVQVLWGHRHEVVMLIKRDRAFRKDWHRYSGPTLMQEVRTCLEDPLRPLPGALRGKQTAACVDGILSSLRTRAGAGLISDIDRYEHIMKDVEGKTFSDVLRALEGA
jgi:hypothetical protein